jgi:excisionase family DNA binding protein
VNRTDALRAYRWKRVFSAFSSETPERQKLWTVAEIAEYLSVEPRTVYVWVREKGMPARKAGDELRFDPDEVERWTMRDRETEKIIEKTRIRALR